MVLALLLNKLKLSWTSFLNFSSALGPKVFSKADLYSGTHAHWGTVSFVCSTWNCSPKALSEEKAWTLHSGDDASKFVLDGKSCTS